MIEKKYKSRNGQALIETALALPVLLLLVFAFLDLGRGVYYYSALQNSVREGARYAVVNKSSEATELEAISKVTGYAVGVGLQPDNVTLVYSGATSEYVSEYVTVAATFEFDPVTPFVSPITLNAESKMILAPIAREKP